MKLPWLLASAISLTAAAPDQQAPVVKLDTGRVQGKATDGMEEFHAIPYAAAPIGPLRWRPPQPAARWQGIRNASIMGPDCVQARTPGDARPMSEDCLTVNVWRPSSRAARALPVLVWIHGGGYVAGGSSDPQTWGNAFARDGIVTVTFNYRLGRLGFFGFPALSKEYPLEAKGNYGLMDQIAALQWVQHNIAAFGGNPHQVTVMGESAGGESALLLAGSPMAQGLFQRMIVQSGGGRTPLIGKRLLNADAPGGVSAEKAGIAFARKMGVEGDDAAALASLRSLPAETINDGLSMLSLLFDGRARFTGPIEDGKLITADPDKAIEQHGRPVPLLIGSTGADLGLNRASDREQAFAAFPNPAAARAAYDPDGQSSLSAINGKIGADRTMAEPARHIAELTAARHIPAWRFRFSYVATAIRSKPIEGAEHASDVAYAFGNLKATQQTALSMDDLKAQRLFHGYFAQFAKMGDPNGAGLPHWPNVDAANGDPIMEVTSEGIPKIGPDPWAARLNATASAASGK